MSSIVKPAVTIREAPWENIIHRTGSRPFSMHRTIVREEDDSALYLHCHPEAEIFYLAEGQVRFQTENQVCTLKEGEGIFIPPRLIHSAVRDCAGPCSFYAMVFSVDMLEDSLPPYCHDYFAALRDRRLDCICPLPKDAGHKALLMLLPQLFYYYSQELAGCELAVNGLLLQIWQELYNLHFSKLPGETAFSVIRSELQSGMEFMQEHYQESLTLSGIASHTGLSKEYFCRSFKAYTGIPPFTYLNRIRIIKSCEALAITNKKITDIAVLCGFNNISYFNRIFYRVMNVTPSNYRRNCSSGLS